MQRRQLERGGQGGMVYASLGLPYVYQAFGKSIAAGVRCLGLERGVGRGGGGRLVGAASPDPAPLAGRVRLSARKCHNALHCITHAPVWKEANYEWINHPFSLSFA